MQEQISKQQFIGNNKTNRLGIIKKILSLCRTPTEKTHILGKYNVSFEQLTNYLIFLVSKDLLTLLFYRGKDFYQTTKKGNNFIEDYERLKLSLTKDRTH